MVGEFEQGVLPAPDRLAALLRREQARDVSVVDLEACGRRDVGQVALVATCTTPRHCRRLGLLVETVVNGLGLGRIHPHCLGERDDTWVVRRARRRGRIAPSCNLAQICRHYLV